MAVDIGEDEVQVEGLTLRGVTRGGVQTCLMVPELGLMFDAGGSVPGQLRYDHVLISHGHQDHLGGLPYLASQRRMGRRGSLNVHVPKAIEAPLRRIFAAWAEIEGMTADVNLQGHDPGDRVELGRGLTATGIAGVHRVPTLAWLIERRTNKLKDQYVGQPGEVLGKLRREGVVITRQESEHLLCVSGDTQIELFTRERSVRSCRVLVYEVTGWDTERSVEQVRRYGHTHIEELLEHIESFEGEALVLVHRSLRHSRRQAEEIVARRFPASVRDRVHVFGH